MCGVSFVPEVMTLVSEVNLQIAAGHSSQKLLENRGRSVPEVTGEIVARVSSWKLLVESQRQFRR